MTRPAGIAAATLLLLALAIASAALLPALAPASRAATPLVADLSRHHVAITTGFAGTDVLLYGAIDEPGDVVVVVRGPSTPVTLYRKSRIAGIWINTASLTFDEAPSFFAVASSRPLAEIADDVVLRRNNIVLDDPAMIRLASAKASSNLAAEWRRALIRNKQRERLYPIEADRIGFLGDQLFRTQVYFPANVPTGTYQVQVFLLRDEQVISAQTTPLIVEKVGVEAEIFDFAHNESALYGLIAIAVALMAGWLAHIAFRKA